jgi:hypothetical protein
VTLDAADPQRVIRLVARRCKLNLIEVRPERVVVHRWGQDGHGDLRPFFKQHSLAKQGSKVFLIDRKRRSSPPALAMISSSGRGFPRTSRWACTGRSGVRGQEEPDDGTAAPATWSSFVWEGSERASSVGRVEGRVAEREPAPVP